jgi:hypothetical protein
MANEPTNVYFALDLGAMRKAEQPTAEIYKTNTGEVVVATHMALGTDANAVLEDDTERKLVTSFSASHVEIAHQGTLRIDHQTLSIFSSHDDLVALAKNSMKPN